MGGGALLQASYPHVNPMETEQKSSFIRPDWTSSHQHSEEHVGEWGQHGTRSQDVSVSSLLHH